jgi:hypothetical protein
MRRFLIVALVTTAACGEVIDRIAVSMGRMVITQSAVEEQVRVTQFLNQESLDLTPAARRRAAERMIEQSLIRREMEFSRYSLPGEDETGKLLDRFRKERFPGEDSFLRALAAYGLTERVLRRQLLFQLATLRFIEIRFRPSVAVGDGEIEIYYREQFVPQWERNQNTPVPSLEEAREQVEAILIQERTDHALNLWLGDARRQARVEFHEEAFQ